MPVGSRLDVKERAQLRPAKPALKLTVHRARITYNLQSDSWQIPTSIWGFHLFRDSRWYISMGIQVVQFLLVTVSQYMNWCSFQWLKNVEMNIRVTEKCLWCICTDTQIFVFFKLHPEEYEFGIIDAHYSIIKTWSCFIKKRCDLWKSHAVIWLPLFEWWLVRMRDEEGSLLWRCDAGNQLTLRLIKAISPTQFEFFTLSSPTFRENWLECSLWAGSTRLHLQNHFPDDYSHFLWEACPE